MITEEWGKSSFSNGSGGSNCVQAKWQRASDCATGSCVEVNHIEDRVLVRDSKDPEGAFLAFTREEWLAFIAGVKNNEFDLPE